MRRTDLDAMEMVLRQAYELIQERKDPAAGRAIAERMLAQLRAEGLDSAYLEWLIALSFDYTLRWVEAVEHIERAHRADPLEPTYLSSRRVIFARVRSALLDQPLDQPPADGPGIAELHAALTSSGECNVDCHMHLAHWYGGQQRWTEMRQLLEAVVLLHPTCKPAWEALTIFARERQDEALATRAQAKVDELTPTGELSPSKQPS